MQRRIQRAFGDLQDFAGDLSEPDVYRPTVQRLKRQNLQQQKIKRPLNEIGWLSDSVSPWLPIGRVRQLPLVSKRKLRGPLKS